jgi:hypothetical protein
MSDSSLSVAAFPHVVSRHVFCVAPISAWQTVLVQSVPVLHLSLSGHAGHVGPPQSLSVSIPFWMLSVHVGTAAHSPPVQRPLEQSVLPRHILPLAQRAAQIAPPQSLSVSSSFLMLSVHDAATVQRPVSNKHVKLWHFSVPAE